VAKVNIETAEDLKKALKDIGYSTKAITEIMKWYNSKKSPNELS
jgi:hypothetical protein